MIANKRILMSVPHIGTSERRYVADAFESNWLSTVGPNLTAFEQAVSARVGEPAVALTSGTAAIHLGLKLLGVKPGDQVLGPTLTFAASANPIRYLHAEPIFLDSNYSTWGLNPELLADVLKERADRNKLPRAVVAVDLFGQCADMDPIRDACRRYDVPVLEDAAEALGATYKGRPAGTLGDVGVFLLMGTKLSRPQVAGCWSAEIANGLKRLGSGRCRRATRALHTNIRNLAITIG